MIQADGKFVSRRPAHQFDLWKNGRPLLTRLDIELTERCNNRCIHCYINRPEDDRGAKDRELTTQAVMDVLVEAASLGCMVVRFTGGEPLLREDFGALYVFARRLGMKVVVMTNATLVTESYADLFSRIPPLLPIEITLYGMTQDAYEGISRSPGSFRAAWDGINFLRSGNVPFLVRGVALRDNREDIKALDRWAADLPRMDDPPALSVYLDLRCRHDSEKKNDRIRNLRLTAGEVIGILTRNGIEAFRKEKREFCSSFLGRPGSRLFGCGAGRGGATLDAYGNLQPCIQLRHPEVCTDIGDGSLRKAMEIFFPKVRRRAAENSEYLETCARCFLRGFCEQCPAKSWMEHGELDTPVDYLCAVTHEQAYYLGLLKEGEKTWEVRNGEERIRQFVDSA